MNKRDKTKKRLLDEAHEMADALKSVGAIDMTTMKEFDAFCLTEVHDLSANRIKNIRREAGVSQAILAKIMNVSVIAIKQWERGERHPSGPALKLLNLVETRGIEAIL